MSKEKPNIVVIGSANMDMTQRVEKFPSRFRRKVAGTKSKLTMFLGGKGFNQARAIKLQNPNANVTFVSAIGFDEAGIQVIEEMKMVGSYHLKNEKGEILKDENGEPIVQYMPGFTPENVGIDYSHVEVLKDCKTDGRLITVNEKGENSMVGKSGDCVKRITPQLIMREEIMRTLESADIITLQMKMPGETVEFLINYAYEHGKQIVVDPTPQENTRILIEKGLLDKISYLTPNEEEAYALMGYLEGKTLDEIEEEYDAMPREERLEKIRGFVSEHPNVIATVGDKGVIYYNGEQVKSQETFPTVCKDSTGAGDTFNGGLVAALSRDESLDTAILYGLKASSMKVQHEGAQNGVPTYKEVRSQLKSVLKVKNPDFGEIE